MRVSERVACRVGPTWRAWLSDKPEVVEALPSNTTRNLVEVLESLSTECMGSQKATAGGFSSGGTSSACPKVMYDLIPSWNC